ncbi:MAG: DEAD/DEAH box helicase [Deltaproteobacteria bacterium]|nr:DEAD/DEAH box helicase [Deltaproteobacteria bacterium]
MYASVVPKSKPDALKLFHAPVRAWFEAAFDAPTKAQALAWPAIASGASTLVLAPTGSGKTLAAFLSAIDRFSFAPPPDPKARCRVLYVSPLKALAVDVERNLRAPLAGIAAVSAKAGVALHPLEIEVRSGDTPQATRARIARTPPDVLITTPESLYLLLTAQARAILASVDVVIVDEIHAMVPTKRGAHLAISLERLEALRKSARPSAAPLQRIGLSATQRPLDEVARFLGGRAGGVWRPVTIIDASTRKDFDVRVEVPVDDLSKLGEQEDVVRSGSAAQGAPLRSIWPAIHPRLVELIRAHRSTILFVNSRRLAERLAQSINEIAGEEIALAHHGSVAREKRAEIEERLKRGDLPAIVATSSLELGIDMGAVDLVVQLEAPPSVASALQRIGRAGHSVGAVSRGVVFPKHRGDLLPCATVVDRMQRGAVEETVPPRNPLDVVAQQIVATVAGPPLVPKTRRAKTAEPPAVPVDLLFDLVTSAAPFAELPRAAFEGVLDMLSGRFPSDDFAELRPRVTWDRIAGLLRPRPGALRIAVTNGGTITDRGLYGVFLAAGGEKSRRVGELDEEMVFESRVGEVFLLGASSWRIEEITHDRVLVSPAPGEPGKMPFWHGDRPGRPRELGRAIGALARELSALPAPKARALLKDRHAFDDRAAKNLLAYLNDEREAASAIPTDDTIVVERFVDELGDFRVCVLSPLGARIHAPWATAVSARLREQTGAEVDTLWSDDGMAFRIPEADRPPEVASFFPTPEEIESIVVDSIGGTSLFAARFREAASRALLLPRKSPQRRTPLWMQRKRAADLLAVASRHRNFPIVLETYREVLRDVFDLPGLVDTLRAIEQRCIRVVTADVRKPSPFAASLLFTWVASFLYDGDAPLAERRAQALSIDASQLRELLGEAELRELLDPDAIDEHERMLQHLVPTRAARHVDALHDLLLSIGELSLDELKARCDGPAAEWVAALEKQRRVFSFRVGRSRRVAAAEDAARYRDALGVVPPMGLPHAFLEPVADPLGDLVGRFARTHGPFVPASVASRLGLAVTAILPVLERLARDGKLVAGEFLRGARGREYCDAGVLRALRRKSLARLRKEVEPVDPIALARFLPAWHRVVPPTEAPPARASAELLLSAIEQLQGAPIPASVLERDVLPARVPGYRPSDLDALCAAGEVVWAGVEAIGPTGGDGRIALYLTSHEPLLGRSPTPVQGELAAKIRALLGARGAIFFSEIARLVGGFPGEILDVLWDMVWAGEVTNDTLSPLRSRMREETPARRAPRGPRLPTRLGAPPGSEGRWSLRTHEGGPSETERRAALARTLLDRHGVLGREAVHVEDLPGGWSSIYDVLKAMEDAGRIRRGYFVAGLGGAQFAVPGADDRLRALRDDWSTRGVSPGAPLILAATDPANPYGAALGWPDHPTRPQRAVSAYVVLHDGALLAWIARGEQSILTFLPSEEPARTASGRALAGALAGLVDRGARSTFLVVEVDGEPVDRSPLARFLREAGFVAGARGWLKKRPPRVPGEA